MTEQMTDTSTVVPHWSGFHHIALVTRDLAATMCFYRDVLGMEIIFTAPAGELHGRDCAFRPEDRSLVAAVFDPGATFLSHISLAPPDEAAGLALRERLIRHHVVVTPIMDQGAIWNMGFLNKNGLALEAAWPKHM